MELTDLRAQLEEDLNWRLAELTVLKNAARNASERDSEQALSKTLIVMLYANFEGFCKFALKLYLRFVQSEGNMIGELSFPLVSLSLFPEFCALWKLGEKDPDKERIAAFLAKYPVLETSLLSMDPDKIVKSGNLNARELTVLLGLVGLDASFSLNYEAALNNLLNRRGGIAHGDRETKMLTLKAYEALESDTVAAMKDVLLVVFRGARDRTFIRTA